MRALKIDAEKRLITEIDIPEGQLLERAYAEIGCDMIEVAFNFAAGNDSYDSVYVDEEGLLKDDPPYWFTIKGAHQPFAGNGVVAGVDPDGETVAARITIEQLQSKVRFWTLGEIRAAMLTGETLS